MKRGTLHFLALLALGSCTMSQDALKEECLRTLSGAATSPDFWVRVHAIEYLAALGYADEARAHVASGLAEFEDVPQKRIGLWRCSYRLSAEEEKAVWLDNIINAYTDSLGADRIHAAETLSKLRVPLRQVDDERVTRDLNNGGALASFVMWGSAFPAKSDDEGLQYERLLSELDEEDVERRKLAAYALGYIGDIPEDAWMRLTRAAMREPTASKAYPYLIGATFSLQPEGGTKRALADSLYQKLISLKDLNSREAKVELCRALAKKGSIVDTDLLGDLLRQEVPVTGGVRSEERSSKIDVQAAAAFAILSIINKHS